MAVGSLAASNEVAVCLSFAERQLARLPLSWLCHLASRNSNWTGELGSCVWLDKNEGFGPAHAGDHLRSSGTSMCIFRLGGLATLLFGS